MNGIARLVAAMALLGALAGCAGIDDREPQARAGDPEATAPRTSVVTEGNTLPGPLRGWLGPEPHFVIRGSVGAYEFDVELRGGDAVDALMGKREYQRLQGTGEIRLVEFEVGFEATIDGVERQLELGFVSRDFQGAGLPETYPLRAVPAGGASLEAEWEWEIPEADVFVGEEVLATGGSFTLFADEGAPEPDGTRAGGMMAGYAAAEFPDGRLDVSFTVPMDEGEEEIADVAAFTLVTEANEAVAEEASEGDEPGADYFTVTATRETEPVVADPDDTATWVNPADPRRSWILATDKGHGLIVYDVAGRIVQQFPDGPLNNVDLRAGFRVDGEPVAIAVATDRDDNSLAFYLVSADGVRKAPTPSLPAGIDIALTDEVYGLALYRSPRTGTLYAIPNFKSGHVFQWALDIAPDGTISAELARRWQLETQPEGAVADEAFEALYIGEEDVALWRFPAEPTEPAVATLVDAVGSPRIPTDDIEGVTIFATGPRSGYLIASSQGNNSYVVYDRGPGNRYLARFEIVSSEAIDRVSETDGIEAVAGDFGPGLEEGLFIVQDDKNEGFEKNFKIVSLAAIRAGIERAVER